MSLVEEKTIRLWNRKYRVEIRGIVIENLRVHFKVKRTLKPKPNSCELSIWGLTKTHRQALEMTPDNDNTFSTNLRKIAFTNQRQVNLVRIEAGYEEGTQQIYYGEVRSANTEFPKAECVTKVASGDGEKQQQLARISAPIGAGTPLPTAVDQIVQLLGVGRGNIDQILPQLATSGAAQIFVQGSAFYGSAFHQFDAVCKAAHLEWSIQNGKLQILNRGKTLSERAILLTGQTGGMVGSPTVDKRGILKIKTLMIPTLYPGRMVVLETEDVRGAFRVEQCEYTGDTHGKEWYIESFLSKIRTEP